MNQEHVDFFVGKTIKEIYLADDCLNIVFQAGIRLLIKDREQGCCEARYMTTDDNLSEFSGAVFEGIAEKETSSEGDDYDIHEIMFIEIKTSKGEFTLKSHNEHNGYYGGFDIITYVEDLSERSSTGQSTSLVRK